jgi:hypothetical protein
VTPTRDEFLQLIKFLVTAQVVDRTI